MSAWWLGGNKQGCVCMCVNVIYWCDGVSLSEGRGGNVNVLKMIIVTWRHMSVLQGTSEMSHPKLCTHHPLAFPPPRKLPCSHPNHPKCPRSLPYSQPAEISLKFKVQTAITSFCCDAGVQFLFSSTSSLSQEVTQEPPYSANYMSWKHGRGNGGRQSGKMGGGREEEQ